MSYNSLFSEPSLSKLIDRYRFFLLFLIFCLIKYFALKWQQKQSPEIQYIKKSKPIVKKYNDQDDYKLVLIAAGIVWSYFQDKFSTTHYDCVIGDNGSGKSTVGDTFVSIGYRPVSMTDPSAANLFRVLGTIEPGQCTIVADEAEKIVKSSEIMSVLKTGYQIKGQVPRINMNIEKQQFYTYCFKMIIAEKSPNQSNARGVLDRTFVFTSYKGKPLYDIKEVLNPVGDRKRQQLLGELTDLRKLMLVYRLIHFKDTINDIDIGIDGRDKELCKPTIQLFYNTSTQKEMSLSFSWAQTAQPRKAEDIDILSQLIKAIEKAPTTMQIDVHEGP